MSDLKIFPMSFSDLNEVAAIERSSFPRPWPKYQFSRELRNPISSPFVGKVHLGDQLQIVGYVIFWVIKDEAHIMDIAVTMDCRRRGYGEELLSFSILRIRGMGARYIFLDVRVSNREAIALYKKKGFANIGIRKGYYENGDDAFVMHLDLGVF